MFGCEANLISPILYQIWRGPAECTQRPTCSIVGLGKRMGASDGKHRVLKVIRIGFVAIGLWDAVEMCAVALIA